MPDMPRPGAVFMSLEALEQTFDFVGRSSYGCSIVLSLTTKSTTTLECKDGPRGSPCPFSVTADADLDGETWKVSKKSDYDHNHPPKSPGTLCGLSLRTRWKLPSLPQAYNRRIDWSLGQDTLINKFNFESPAELCDAFAAVSWQTHRSIVVLSARNSTAADIKCEGHKDSNGTRLGCTYRIWAVLDWRNRWRVERSKSFTTHSVVPDVAVKVEKVKGKEHAQKAAIKASEQHQNHHQPQHRQKIPPPLTLHRLSNQPAPPVISRPHLPPPRFQPQSDWGSLDGSITKGRAWELMTSSMPTRSTAQSHLPPPPPHAQPSAFSPYPAYHPAAARHPSLATHSPQHFSRPTPPPISIDTLTTATAKRRASDALGLHYAIQQGLLKRPRVESELSPVQAARRASLAQFAPGQIPAFRPKAEPFSPRHFPSPTTTLPSPSPLRQAPPLPLPHVASKEVYETWKSRPNPLSGQDLNKIVNRLAPSLVHVPQNDYGSLLHSLGVDSIPHLAALVLSEDKRDFVASLRNTSNGERRQVEILTLAGQLEALRMIFKD
ncbi:hypothetical protein T439DRAFT_100456 [Meredithblackwellia eburnea MCA 4105]